MLLLLPGLICDSRMYAPQLDAFRDSVAVDGYGPCDAPADSLAEMARIALAAADAAGAESFDLFGHSMGGRVALEVWRQAPQRVRRLALVSTGVHDVAAGEADKRHALQALGHAQGFEALVDQWLPPMVAEANRDVPAYAAMKDMCLRRGQQVFDAQIRALLGRPQVQGLLPQINCPTLVMTGALDSWAPPAQHQAIADAIPDAMLVVVPGAGHMLPLEAPDAVNQAIARWRDMPISAEHAAN